MLYNKEVVAKGAYALKAVIFDNLMQVTKVKWLHGYTAIEPARSQVGDRLKAGLRTGTGVRRPTSAIPR
ncbi:MAG: hypothetical protein JWQ71_315 [Pedosphaera sp.]|nr:hypothetical protein [Pedosphaera sp.]